MFLPSCFEYLMKNLSCTLDARLETSNINHKVGPHHDSEERRILARLFFSRFIIWVYFSPPLFFTSDALLFVAEWYVLKLRNTGNPLQVLKVDTNYVELSNLQQSRSFCPRGPKWCVSRLT
jgi:hypothetical protein